MADDTEEWRPIPGYEGWYSVSSHGRVRRDRRGTSARPGRPRKITIRRDGGTERCCVSLSKNGMVRVRLVHQLVCEAFHGPRPTPEHEVLHWDDDGLNNHKDNVRWGTSAENKADMLRNGNRAQGERHGNAKATDEIVGRIRRLRGQGMLYKDIAPLVGLSKSQVQRIDRGIQWKGSG